MDTVEYEQTSRRSLPVWTDRYVAAAARVCVWLPSIGAARPADPGHLEPTNNL